MERGDGFSPDDVPVVGRLSGLAGSWWVAGFAGYGMAYGFRIGRLLADLVEGEQADAFDLFTADRFA